MKPLFKLFLIPIAASLASNSYAFPQLPFCPAGGPPGWVNYFNYKRDLNTWRRYSQNVSPAYYGPGYGYGYTPAYLPAYSQPYNYSTPPYNYYQSYSQPGTAPSRNN